MAFTLEDRIPRVQVTLTASTGPITLDYEFFDENDIDVIKDDGTNPAVTTIDQADFTVTGTPSDDGIAFESGSVTLDSAFTGTVTCIRNLAIDRLTQQPVAGKFKINSLNVAISRAFAILQEQRLDLDRAFRLLPEDPSDAIFFPDVDDRKGMFLWFDSVTGAPSVAAATTGTAAVDLDLTTWLANIDTNDLVLGNDQGITTKAGDMRFWFDEVNDRFMWDISGVNVLALDDVGNRMAVTASDDGSAFALQRSGTAAATNDIAMSWQLENDAVTPQNVVYGRIQVNSEVVTDGAEVGSMEILVMDAGTLTRFMDLDASSTPQKIRADKFFQPNGGISLGDGTELTIATGSITPTTGMHVVDTESDAASDDLTDIDDANMGVGALLLIKAINTARSVVVKHTASGNHKIVTSDGLDVTLDDDAKSILLELRAGGEWHEVTRSERTTGSGAPGQIQIATTTTQFDITTVLPFDNTIPQNTEGDEILTQAITPQNASSTLLIEVVVHCGTSANGIDAAGALFVDSTAGALAAFARMSNSGTAYGPAVMSFTVAAGSTTARTYKIRMGPGAAGTCYVNQDTTSNPIFSTVGPWSSLKITEILP